MTKHSGMIRPDLQALPQVKDRMTFLYLEHCTLGRQDGAITMTDETVWSISRQRPFLCCCWDLGPVLHIGPWN